MPLEQVANHCSVIFHWVKGEAEVLKPVSIFGFFARVLPGTNMKLEMIPVTESVWLVSRFAVDNEIVDVLAKVDQGNGFYIQ